MKRELELEIARIYYHNMRREYIIQQEFIKKRIKDCDDIMEELQNREAHTFTWDYNVA